MPSRSTDIDIQWEDRKLEKNCASDKNGQRRFGANNWKILKRRLASLRAAPSLADMENVPGKCHALRENRLGDFAVSLWGQFRLIFSPSHDPLPLDDYGSLDRKRVTKIKIKEVEDYHGD